MRPPVLTQNIALLRQGQELLASIDASIYSERAADGSSSGVGPHLRHCLDFYRCFELGLGVGEIDYDERGRGAEIEQSLDVARVELDRAIEVLERLEAEDRPVRVRVEWQGRHGPRFFELSSMLSDFEVGE